jgi:uncharacterized protein (TIGR02246 family)
MITMVDVVPTTEQGAVREIVVAFEAAWNRHDPDRFAALLAEDAEWVNVVGWWWRGQSNVKRGFEWIHQVLFKNTPWRVDSISIRFPTPDTAIAAVTGTTGSYTTPDGAAVPGKRDRLSIVAVKRSGRWLIVSGQNTEINPEAEQHNPVKTP